MKTISMIGSMVVTIALVFYSIGFVKEGTLRDNIKRDTGLKEYIQ